MVNSSQRYVLLAVTGMSPQIITETLYALYQQGAGLPEAIKIITTKKGRDQAWLTLGVSGQNTSGHQGKLAEFTAEYNLPSIPFQKSDIRVITDAAGHELDDVTTEQHHTCLADFILNEVNTLTQDPNIALHASLAGGRKTMTFFLGYAMSLYGRQQDKLSHVLVSEGFENNPAFFYPTQQDYPIHTQRGEVINAKDAQVHLAEIPFVRFRDEAPTSLIEGKQSYSQLVASLNQVIEDDSLVIDTQNVQIICSGIVVKLPPALFSFYWWVVDSYQQTGQGLGLPNEIGDETYAQGYLSKYALVTDELKAEQLGSDTFKHGLNKAQFLEKKSKLKKHIESGLNVSRAKPFILDDVSELHPDTELQGLKMFGVKTPIAKINII